MTRREERTLSAYLTSVDYLLQNPAITATVPYFTPAFNTFKITVKAIKNIAEQQAAQNNVVGTRSKTDLRKECFTTLRTLSEVLKAHAVGINDHALASQVSEPSSQFVKLADTTFLTVCRQYHTLTASLLADLVPFNIDAPFLASFKTSVDTYEMILTTPRLNIIARADSTKLLKDLFAKGRAELDKLITLITVKRIAQPSFFAQFIETTRVIDNGSTMRALQVSAKDEQGVGVKSVNVLFMRKSDSKAIEYKTNENGTIMRTNFKADEYVVTVTKTGYAPFTTTILIETGTTFMLNIAVNTVDKTIA